MRNIEDIAAEEDQRLRGESLARSRRLLAFLGLGLGLWGWSLFHQGDLADGAALILGSLLCWGLSWDLGTILGMSWSAWGLGLLAALPPLVLYLATRMPSFYWGKDPDFWLAVQGGAVGEPPWSPLGYLAGQAFCRLFPSDPYAVLPALPGFWTAAALFLAAREWWLGAKTRHWEGALVLLGLGWVLALSPPLWSNATLASGLPEALGFFLFLLERALLEKKASRSSLYFVLGLLFCAHPLWGFLGLVLLAASWRGARWDLGSGTFALALGLSPYLWVLFRADAVFPSWGGAHPFLETAKLLRYPRAWMGEWMGPWDGRLLTAFGYPALVLGLLVLFLLALAMFKTRTGGRSSATQPEFWTWVLSGACSILFLSRSPWALGPVAPLFLFGLAGMVWRLYEKGAEKKHGTRWVRAVLGGALVLCLGSVFLPGQFLDRSGYYFPQQHALNLLRSTEDRSVLVCGDPFEASACRAARFVEPLFQGTLVLDEKYLNRRWYAAQCIEDYPWLLFPALLGPPDAILRGLIQENRGRLVFHWALSDLPEGWKDLRAFPTVLTQRFEGEGEVPWDPKSVQYRLDLTALPKRDQLQGREEASYFDRYVAGFTGMGKRLLDEGQYMSAVQSLNRALKLDPGDSQAQALLSRMYSEKKVLEAAQLEFEKTLQSHPKRIEGLMASLEKAQKAGDEGQSVTLLDQMIHLNAELADAQYQLSVIYGRQGRSAESKALLESSVQLNPKQVEGQLSMGRLMTKMGNRLRAEEAFRSVLMVDPQNKEAQVELWKLLNK